jgi:uncharacterized repeat protein (TIGR03803 family)
MKQRLSLALASTLILCAAVVTFSNVASAQASNQLIYSFPTSGDQGYWPTTQLVYRSGNFFGATYYGGGTQCNCGVVFELSPAVGGGWNYRALHAFRGSPDGGYPYANIVFDSAGNLYGVTSFGGKYFSRGTAFELSPNGDDSWTYSNLYSFGQTDSDARYPGGLAIDAAGNLYGVAGGGANNVGTVFTLVPGAGGTWTESLIYSFLGTTDGFGPNPDLSFDALGNLYGTTYSAGANNLGTVFELTRGAGGEWTENTLFNSDSSLGNIITSTLDSSGNVYCTTYNNEPENLGAVFEVSPTSGGGWSSSTLHTFVRTPQGQWPKGTLTVNANGILYGTTQFGGTNNLGIVFELQPSAGGTWVFGNLYSFAGGTVDGGNPLEGLTLVDGSLYGTTVGGGAYSNGTIFKLTP